MSSSPYTNNINIGIFRVFLVSPFGILMILEINPQGPHGYSIGNPWNTHME